MIRFLSYIVIYVVFDLAPPLETPGGLGGLRGRGPREADLVGLTCDSAFLWAGGLFVVAEAGIEVQTKVSWGTAS